MLSMIGKHVQKPLVGFVLFSVHAKLQHTKKCPRCEPFSTYPRTYDLLHANHVISHYQSRGDGCLVEDIMLEMDRMIRPQVLSSTDGATTFELKSFWSPII